MQKIVTLSPIGEHITLEQYMLSIEREYLFNILMRNGWNYAKTAAESGITYKSALYSCEKCGLKEKKDTRNESAIFTRLWPKLRALTLEYYGEACQKCGKTKESGAVLHVDHIKPISRYPELMLDINNLQVLCRSCNVAKGNRHENDYRKAA